MPPRRLERIRSRIRRRQYDLTAHASEEAAEDLLDILDVESAVLSGRLVGVDRSDPRGTRYVLEGVATDGSTPVGVVGRFAGSARFLVITVYKVGNDESEH